MKTLLTIGKSIPAALLRTPVTGEIALLVGDALLTASVPVFERRPGAFLPAYRAVRFALRRLGRDVDAVQSGKDRSLRARLWRKANARLGRSIRRWLDAPAGDPERLREVNRALIDFEAHERIVRPNAYPWRANVELTSVCNLRCRMCPQATVREIEKVFLEPSHLQRMEPALRYLQQVSLVGFGETLLHRDFPAFLRGVKAPGRSVRIITNGLLIPEKTARVLVETGLDELWVSIDAVTPDTYEFVRGVDGLERILVNLKRLNGFKQQAGADKPELSLTFVAMRRNIPELPDYVRLAADLGAAAVHVNYVIVYHESMAGESLYGEPELANRWLDRAREVAAETGVTLLGPPNFDLERHAALQRAGSTDPAVLDGYRRCREPWEFVYFNCTGHVVPCCTEQARPGDLKREAFRDIWRGDAYAAYRRSLLTDHPSPFCRNCMQAAQRGVNEREAHFRIMTEDGRLA